MTDTLNQNRENHARQIERIRADRDLSAEAKRRKMSEVHEEATNRHRELAQQYEEAKAEEIRRLERHVFGISYPPEARSWQDKEAVRRSYRDAALRVLGMETEALERVLDRAERVGDATLAQAVYHEAIERGLGEVAHRYTQGRPDAKRRWEEYVAARQAAESPVAPLFSPTFAAPLKPPELGG